MSACSKGVHGKGVRARGWPWQGIGWCIALQGIAQYSPLRGSQAKEKVTDVCVGGLGGAGRVSPWCVALGGTMAIELSARGYHGYQMYVY